MSKRLFLFGIGGTGSRVIKSLIMLLASGCKLPGDVDTVVPILIDPDTGNGDLNRTKDILRLYQNIRNRVDKPDDFFAQKIATINELSDGNADNIKPDYFQFNIDGTNNSSFRDFISFNSLDEDSKKFLSLLYSQENLDSSLDVGFKGNPHIGSVVLNKFTKSEDFQQFGQVFTQGDVVFIANSIFGGTGPAGFPLLLKTLRYGDFNITNATKIKNSPIGGITYLPYFKVEKDDTSKIDSEAFDEKTKQALDYYNRSIINEDKINALYFLGLKGNRPVYKNNEGEGEQKNDAHFLELAGALSIFDFCSELPSYNVTDGKAANGTSVKEFGIERETDNITFNDLDSVSTKQIASQLSKFYFFSEYLSKGLPRALGVSRWTVKKTKLNKEFFNSADYQNYIEKFCEYFDNWIQEMDNNTPAFSPFRSVSKKNSLNFLKTQEVDHKDGFKKLDVANCQLINKTESKNEFTQLVKLFGRSSDTVLSKNNVIKD